MQKNPSIVVRQVRAADEPDWRRLWTGYLQFYKSKVADEVYRTSFARLLSEDEHEFHGLIAEIDGQPVGLVHYLFHRHMWRVENTCYLQDLYADPKVRGTGVGRALIEAVYAAADDARCGSVYWLTQEFNYPGRTLYDRIGTKTDFVHYKRPT